MKKLSVLVFAFVMIFAGAVLGIGFLPNVTFGEEETTKVIEIKNKDEFIEVFSNLDQYLKITLTDDIVLGDEDIINTSSKTFKGTFDGNGYTVSNLTIASNDNNFGLFSIVENAVIKNLKIDNEITFMLSSGHSFNNIGALVGYGRNITIENCELTNTVNFVVGGNDKLIVNGDANVGGFVGYGQDSKISNCLTNANINVETNVNFENSKSNIGGMIGYAGGGSIEKSLSAGNITFANNEKSLGTQFNCGGVVGEISGYGATARDVMFWGEIKNSEKSFCGAIVGNISTDNPIKNGNVEYAYWIDKNLEAFGKSNGYATIGKDTLRQNEFYGIDFFEDKENWYPLPTGDTLKTKNGWDFTLTWCIKDSMPKLQIFEYFNFSFSTFQNNILKGYTFENIENNDDIKVNTNEEDGSVESIDVKFGKTVTMNLVLDEDYVGFYELSYVSVNNSIISTSLYNKNPEDAKTLTNEGYLVTVSSSDMTDGAYSFEFKTIKFNCEVTISDEAKENNQGGVKERNGQDTRKNLSLTLSFDSSPITVVAEGNGIYSFAYWELYFGEELYQGQIDSGKSFEIKFGKEAPFDSNKEFKLVAYFDEQETLPVKFSNSGAGEGIKSITFYGDDYSDSNIKVPISSKSVLLKVVIKKGYEFDVDSFETSLRRYYGSNSTDSLLRSFEENDEESIYNFNINMNAISGNFSGEVFTMTLFIKEINDAQAPNLLWLYITIPVVVVVGVGIAVLIILLKRRGVSAKMKNKKQEAEEETDYQDYYI